MRIVDGMMALPALLLAMLLLTTVGANPVYVALGIAVVFMPRSARILRGVALCLAASEFIDAARLAASAAPTSSSAEMLPNAWAPIIVEGDDPVRYAILLATSLGFLGLGAQPPAPDWGLMINEALPFMAQAPWLAILPAIGDLHRRRRRQPAGRRHARDAVSPPRRGDRVTTPAGRGPVLDVRDLRVTYRTASGRIRAVRGVSFTLEQGRVLGLVGESGSGKSTMALAVMGALGAEARVTGEVRFRGDDLVGRGRARLRRLWGRRLAMVFQDPAGTLNPVLTVGDQVAEVLVEHEGLGRAAARARVLELFAAVQLPNPEAIVGRYPHQLSGGQQQRVSIALALACNPDVLVLDEPTTGLDVTTEARILDLVEALRQRTSASILYITHNLGVIGRLAHEVAVMYAGELVEQGPVDLVFARPRHPYTVALLDCLPRVDRPPAARLLPAIGGTLPDPPAEMDACLFAPRCAAGGRAVPRGASRLVR